MQKNQTEMFCATIVRLLFVICSIKIIGILGDSNVTHKKEQLLAGGWWPLSVEEYGPLFNEVKDLFLYGYYGECNIFLMTDVCIQVVAGINYRICCLIGKRCSPEQCIEDYKRRFENRNNDSEVHIFSCGEMRRNCTVKIYKDLHQNMTVTSTTCSDDQKSYMHSKYNNFM